MEDACCSNEAPAAPSPESKRWALSDLRDLLVLGKAAAPAGSGVPRERPVALVIHAHAAAAAGVGAGLAQLPGSDAPVLCLLQANLVRLVAEWHGISMNEGAALQLVLSLGATMAGRNLTQGLVGWWPGIGNGVNAATAAALTEAVGWAAVRWARAHAATEQAAVAAA
jgi:uncharacterized protein (DUF697 family)